MAEVLELKPLNGMNKVEKDYEKQLLEPERLGKG